VKVEQASGLVIILDIGKYFVSIAYSIGLSDLQVAIGDISKCECRTCFICRFSILTIGTGLLLSFMMGSSVGQTHNVLTQS
jgi:hypothetical protein